MGMIVVLVFLGVFAVVALLLIALGSGASQEAKQVLASLDSALATETPEVRDQIVNLRKSELLSGIPWLNRKTAEVRSGAAPAHPALSGRSQVDCREPCFPVAGCALRSRLI